ncbi:MAG TPA: virulence-associated E family protein [Burkholderiales bacterium]|nr:virulence-associated E family protein [Burkholderiales bacterium]
MLLRDLSVPASTVDGLPDGVVVALARTLRPGAGRRVAASRENAYDILEHDDVFVGRLRRNDFARRVELDGRGLDDFGLLTIARELSTRYGPSFPTGVVHEASLLIAGKSAFHPLRDYLSALTWDGVPRLQDACKTILTVDDFIAGYHDRVLALFCIQAVRRIFEPGCKADHVLVLEGDQGIGKSSFVRRLAGDENFSDADVDLRSKDAAMALTGGVWIWELPELAGLNRHESEQIKAFLTQQVDSFRPPYGRCVENHPRQWSAVATTNISQWLRDDTGGRRFWPVYCRRIDLDALNNLRDRLWGEAVHRYRAGEAAFFTPGDRAPARQQAQRHAVDPWHDVVVRHLLGRWPSIAELEAARATEPVRVAPGHLLTDALHVPVHLQNQAAVARLVAVLRTLGFKRRQVREAARRRWTYQADDFEKLAAALFGEQQEADT